MTMKGKSVILDGFDAFAKRRQVTYKLLRISEGLNFDRGIRKAKQLRRKNQLKKCRLYIAYKN